MIKKYNPNDKYNNLYHIASKLSVLHKCNLVHGDFHSGNLLLLTHAIAYISDLGLSRPADKPNKSNEIYGRIRKETQIQRDEGLVQTYCRRSGEED